MLASPKSRALETNFAGQWLEIRNLKFVEADKKMFPQFDDELRDDMQKETETFFDYIMRQDRSVLEFINADYTFINERLARYYGIPGVTGEEFRRVSLVGTPLPILAGPLPDLPLGQARHRCVHTARRRPASVYLLRYSQSYSSAAISSPARCFCTYLFLLL